MADVVNLISFPFRVDLNSMVVTHEQNSDEQLGEEIAMLMCTRVGERIMSPGFGITDFVFSTVNEAELVLKVKAFDIPAKIINVTTVYPAEGIQSVTVEFNTKIGRVRA